MAYKQQYTDNAAMCLTSGLPEFSRIKKRPVEGYPGCYWKSYRSGSFKITYSNVVKTATIDLTFLKKHSTVVRVGYTVSCEAVFSFESPLVVEGWFMRPYELIDDSSRLNTELVVGDERIKVHRGFLSSISPVFEAMFAARTKETETGIVEITDMDATTVKNAIDFCLGHDVQEKTLDEFLGMHQFVDKYAILLAIARIETCIAFKTTIDNLAHVIDYAWKNSHKNLQMLCARIYGGNVESVVFRESIIALPNDVRLAVMDAAYLAFNEIKKDNV